MYLRLPDTQQDGAMYQLTKTGGFILRYRNPHPSGSPGPLGATCEVEQERFLGGLEQAMRMEMQTKAAAWRHWRSLGMGLCLFFAACTPAPAPPALTPTTSGPTQATPITTYQGHTGPVYSVAWSPDGTRIASGGTDSTIQIWDVRTGQRLVLYSGHVGTVYTVAWSPDGTRIASGSDDSTVQVWDATTGRLFLT